ncbi:MAG: acetate--CoA ligase family protein, partial [Aigarchaeota archaeon]|nr:acetate--CoA ligase family protein [Aigarchaeota archaeon]
VKNLGEHLPKGVIVSNPVDLTGSAVAHDFQVALEALAQDPEVSILLPTFVFQDGMLLQTISELHEFMPSLKNWGKTIVACAAGGEFTKTQQLTMQKSGVPVIETPRRAVLALARIAKHVDWRSSRRSKTHGRVSQDERVLKMNRAPWMHRTPTEKEVKDLLRAYGIQTPRYQLVAPEQGVEALNLPYPLALKVCSSNILHKSEVGGVALGINDQEQLQDQLRTMRKRFPRENLLVETMEKGEVEIIVGLIRDRAFGLALMVGLGGVFAEVLRDVAFRVLPISRIDARDMLRQLRSTKILEGYRGMKPNKEALLDLLLKVSTMGMELEELIDQLDLNPVLLGEKSAIVVDAKLLPIDRPRAT